MHRRYLSVVVASTAIAVGCSDDKSADDVVLEPPPSLKGEYVGKYVWTFLPQPRSYEQNIKWKFTDTEWFMTADSSQPLDVCFCISFGSYTVEDRVRLLYRSPQPWPDTMCTGGTCDPNLSPDGTFLLQQPHDSVILKYMSQDSDTMKEIKLARAPSS